MRLRLLHRRVNHKDNIYYGVFVDADGKFFKGRVEYNNGKITATNPAAISAAEILDEFESPWMFPAMGEDMKEAGIGKLGRLKVFLSQEHLSCPEFVGRFK